MRNRFSVLGLVLIFGLAGRLSAQVADPTPSPVLAYEGRLTESNALVTGTRPFVFSILDANGNELWNSGTQNLNVVEGLYGVVLGSTGMPAIPTSLTLKANLHLHVLADGVALAPDISLIPALQASTSWSVIGPFFGDISGTQQGISVDKLKGIPIDLSGVTAGQVLTFDGTSWTASTAAGGQGPQGPAGRRARPEPPARLGHRTRRRNRICWADRSDWTTRSRRSSGHNRACRNQRKRLQLPQRVCFERELCRR